MQTKGQTPLQMFRDYKRKTEEGLSNYTRLMWVAPLEHVKELEREMWKYGVLADVFGQVAGKRDGIDYIQKWRSGE